MNSIVVSYTIYVPLYIFHCTSKLNSRHISFRILESTILFLQFWIIKQQAPRLNTNYDKIMIHITQDLSLYALEYQMFALGGKLDHWSITWEQGTWDQTQNRQLWFEPRLNRKQTCFHKDYENDYIAREVLAIKKRTPKITYTAWFQLSLLDFTQFVLDYAFDYMRKQRRERHNMKILFQKHMNETEWRKLKKYSSSVLFQNREVSCHMPIKSRDAEPKNKRSLTMLASSNNLQILTKKKKRE